MASDDIENLSMFCFQCEQTAKGEGCTVRGVCTKYVSYSSFVRIYVFLREPKIAALQDHIMWGLQSISVWAMKALDNNIALPENTYMDVAKVRKKNSYFYLQVQYLFSTLTNVNFAASDLTAFLIACETLRNQIKKSVAALPEAPMPAVAFWIPTTPMAEQAKEFLIPKSKTRNINPVRRWDCTGLTFLKFPKF